MSYSLIAHSGAGSTDGNTVTTSAINTTGATLLIISAASYSAMFQVTVSDSKSNSWNPLGASAQGNSRCQMFYSIPTSVGTGHTFTINTSTSFPCINVQAWSGATATPFDQENGGVVNGGNVVNTGSVTPSENNELIVAGLCKEASSTVSIDSSMTISDSIDYLAANHFGGAMAYKVQGTAAAINPQWSTNLVNSDMAARIATFKASAITGWGLLLGQERSRLVL